MTILKTTSSKAALAVAIDASAVGPSSASSSSSASSASLGLRVHRPHQHYAPHNVVIVASPSRRATLLQRQVARALDAIDMDDVVASLEANGSAVCDLYPSPASPLTTAHKTPPASASSSSSSPPLPSAAVSPSAGFQISPNAIKRKRSHSTASSASSTTMAGEATADKAAAMGSPSVSELRVDIDTADKTAAGRVVVAKRAIKGGVTPSKRCKDKKKKQKVDVIERALKRFRAELRNGSGVGDSSASDGTGAGGESCFEFTSVCHRDPDADTDAGLTTPRHSTSTAEGIPAEWMMASSTAMNSHVRRSESVAQPMRVQVGVAAAQGARAYMEDRFSVTARLFEHHSQRDDVQSPASLLALYDGHNGALAAEYGARRFKELLSDNEYLLDLCKRPVYVALSDDDIERVEEVLKDVFEIVDDEIVELTISEGKRDGSTVLLGLLIGGKMFVANLGDTRGVLGTASSGRLSVDGNNDDVVRVSVDHKPDLKVETERIEEAGGKVIFSGCWRVAHDEVPLRLAVSRSLGDHPLKANLPLSCSAPLVSVVPDIQVLDVSGSSDDVLVFATDGLWDRLSDDDAIRVARTKIAEFNSNASSSSSSGPPAARNAMQSAAIALVETALVKRSMDNITAMVISFSTESAHRLDGVEVGEPLDDVETMDDL